MKKRRIRNVPQQESCHNQAAWAALLEGLLAVTRARDRGEPYWMLDVRRAAARVVAARAALRQGRARTTGPEGKEG